MAALDPNHPFWSYIDGVLVINLDSSQQRYESMLENVGNCVPKEKWHRLQAVPGRELPDYGDEPWFQERTAERAPFWGGTAGCLLSHKKAIETARDNHWERVLILEDDVCLADTVSEAWDLAAEALKKLSGRYMLYLGCCRPVPYGWQVMKGSSGHGLWKISGVLGAHAYVVPQELYEQILHLMSASRSIWEWLSVYRATDVLYRDFVSALPGVSIYSISPVLVEQTENLSVICNGNVAIHTDLGATPPISYASMKGIWYLITYPLHRLKVWLNSIRTHRRALKGGLPGYSKRR